MKNIPSFENFLNESVWNPGQKAKKFESIVKRANIDSFDKRNKEEQEFFGHPLPKEYHDALKKLNIKESDAAICQESENLAWEVIEDALSMTGLKHEKFIDKSWHGRVIIYNTNQ